MPPPADSYALFASYACDDGKRFGGVPFKKFTELLRELVAGKVQKARKQLCFVDTHGIKVGDPWEEVLARGIRASEVLVCLVSPRYLESAWCGRELEVFRRRLAAWKAAPGHPGRFVFVLWWEKPKDRQTLPKSLGAFAPTDSGFPPSYDEKGLRQLATLNAGHDDLQLIAEALSDRIVETLDHAGGLQEGEPIEDFTSFPSAFEEPEKVAPYQIVALATMPGGLAWSATPTAPNLAQVLDRIGSRGGVTVHPLEVAVGVKAALVAARDQRQLVLVLTDTGAGPADGLLAEVNAVELPNFTVLVVHSGAAAAGRLTSEAWAAQFPGGSIPAAFQGGRLMLTGPNELENSLEGLVTRARQGLIQADAPERAKDDALTRKAAEEGVPIEQAPMLAPKTPA